MTSTLFKYSWNEGARDRMKLQYKSVIAWDLGLEQIHPISDFAL